MAQLINWAGFNISTNTV